MMEILTLILQSTVLAGLLGLVGIVIGEMLSSDRIAVTGCALALFGFCSTLVVLCFGIILDIIGK